MPTQIRSAVDRVVPVLSALAVLAATASASPHSPLAARFESFDNVNGKIHVQDLDGDQRPDIVGLTGQSVYVRLATIDRRFAPPVLYPVGAKGSDIELADLDDDGRLDAVVASYESSTICVLFGMPGGAFGPATSSPISTPPEAVSTGDFDEDGIVDLAATNSSSDNATLLRGVGGGAFVFHAEMAMGLGPVEVRLHDFTGDGHVDLFVHDHPSGSASVFPGDGDGGFGAAIVSSPTDGGFMLEFGHLNGDGQLDFVSGSVRPMLGVGDGSFYAMANRPVPSGAGLAIGDVDGDGFNDVATATQALPGYIYSDQAAVLLGRGNGTFESGYLEFGVSPTPVDLAVADVTGDQQPDLLVAHYSQSIAVVPGGDAFGVETEFGVLAAPNAVRIGDFDGDGGPDLATTHTPVSAANFPLASHLVVHHGFANGTFGSSVPVPVGYRARSLGTGDLNADGRLDFVTGNYGDSTITILLRTATNSYTRSDVPVGARPTDLEVVDVDGDGKLDVLIAPEAQLGVRRLLGNGDGTFGPVALLVFEHPIGSFAAGDLNGDGNPDLAMAVTSSSSIVVRLGDGAGGFGARTDYAVGPGPSDIAIASLDLDGDLDLAVYSASPPAVTLLRNTGTGSFGGRTDLSAGVHGGASVAVADLDGDGWGDIVATRGGNNTLGVWLSDGLGGFAERVDLGAGTGPLRVAIGDLDLDGRADVVATCYVVFFSMNYYTYEMHGNEITVLMNRPESTVDVRTPVTADISLAVERVSPNPSSGAIRFAYVLPTASRSRFAVIDVQGREVASFEGSRAPGRHQAAWDGRGPHGAVPPGVYFLRLHAGNRVSTRRFALIR